MQGDLKGSIEPPFLDIYFQLTVIAALDLQIAACIILYYLIIISC